MPLAQCLSTVFLILAMACATLQAAVIYPPFDPNRPVEPTMVGTVWEALLTDANGKTQKDRLVFAERSFTSTWLKSAGVIKMPYTQTVGKTVDDPIPWKGELSDNQGNKIVFDGKAEKNDMQGTLTVTPTKGEALVYAIVAAKSGTDEARRLGTAKK